MARFLFGDLEGDIPVFTVTLRFNGLPLFLLVLGELSLAFSIPAVFPEAFCSSPAVSSFELNLFVVKSKTTKSLSSLVSSRIPPKM